MYGGDYFIAGRRVWPDRDGPPIEFDAAVVVGVLEDAARRARGGTSAPAQGG